MSVRFQIASRFAYLAGCCACLLTLVAAFAPMSPAQDKNVPASKDVLVDSQGVEQVAYINEHIEKLWKENDVQPSERCTDYEFIRRASLDIIGRIAKPHEIERFKRDLKEHPQKARSMLIERLLASEEYAQNWAGIWTVHLLTRSGSSSAHQEELREWLTIKFTEHNSKDKANSYAPDWSKIVTELVTATGTTESNPAVNFILHHLGEATTGDKEANGAFDMVPVTSRTTKLFLGLRTQCIQCHDHPFNTDWLQEQFWGINAFFRQTDAPRGRPTVMAKKAKKADKVNVERELVDNPNLNRKGLVFYERRNTLVLPTDARFLDGVKMVVKGEGATRRKELAKFIVASPYFAKVYVNRTWGHFFGKSFTKDIPDDFGGDVKISHPDLLDRLAEDWAKKYNHNPKDLIRWICNSRAYGLSSIANKTNDKPEDEVLFARMILKAMSPEQLFESLMVATQAKVAESRESKTALREEWLRKLIVNFGDDEGNEVSYNGTVVQALMLMNGQDINSAIMDEKNGTVAAILKRRAYSPTAAKDATRDIYLAGLNRPPTAKEFAKIFTKDPKSGTFLYEFRPEIQRKMTNPAVFWTGFYQDMMWAVLNSNEFMLNH